MYADMEFIQDYIIEMQKYAKDLADKSAMKILHGLTGDEKFLEEE